MCHIGYFDTISSFTFNPLATNGILAISTTKYLFIMFTQKNFFGGEVFFWGNKIMFGEKNI